MQIDQAFCDIHKYVCCTYTLCVRVNVCNPILTVYLVHESLHMSVSVHWYLYIVHLYKKIAAMVLQ